MFDRRVADGLLACTCGHAPEKRSVLGPTLLAILNGQRRYPHTYGLRLGRISADVLNVPKIVSEDIG